MINIVKSQPAPECLEIEKRKKSGNHLCGDTYKRLNDDFYGKCYLCEDSKPTEIHIDHLEPHFNGKNKDRQFDWNNLFFACAHCNRIKSSSEKEILNCTNNNHKITDWIKFEIKPFPRELPKIKAVEEMEKNNQVHNTIELLTKIYNYCVEDNSFSQTKDAAYNLRGGSKKPSKTKR